MRRRAIVVLAALVPLAAVVLAVALTRSNTKTPERLPVAAGGTATETAAARSGVATTIAGPQSAIYPYPAVVYRAADDLPELRGQAHASRISGEVTIESVRTLAAALGVSGEPVEDAGAFTVGTDQLRLVVQRRGGGLWYLGGTSSVSSSTAVGGVCTPEGACPAPVTTIPERPAGLPTEDEARARALDLLRSAGMEVDDADVTVDDLITSWQVLVAPRVDGVPTEGFEASVVISETGVTSANGFLGRAEQADEYPLFGTRAAIDQLNRGVGYGIRPLLGVAQPAIAPGEPAPTSTLAPRVVTLTGATLVLAVAPSIDGSSAYFVPAYRFTATAPDGPVVSFAIDQSWFTPAEPPKASDVGSAPVGSAGSGGGSATVEPPIASAPGALPPETATTVPGG